MVNEEVVTDLVAWKKGIKKAGHEFFCIESSSLETATSKWELKPNHEFIVKSDGLSGYSHGIQALVALMYSFYDPDEGQLLLNRIGAHNFVSAQRILDLSAREIIAELWLYHTWW